jgi:hypothetical protein
VSKVKITSLATRQSAHVTQISGARSSGLALPG